MWVGIAMGVSLTSSACCGILDDYWVDGAVIFPFNDPE